MQTGKLKEKNMERKQTIQDHDCVYTFNHKSTNCLTELKNTVKHLDSLTADS